MIIVLISIISCISGYLCYLNCCCNKIVNSLSLLQQTKLCTKCLFQSSKMYNTQKLFRITPILYNYFLIFSLFTFFFAIQFGTIYLMYFLPSFQIIVRILGIINVSHPNVICEITLNNMVAWQMKHFYRLRNSLSLIQTEPLLDKEIFSGDKVVDS
jgi:hypothetical protein